jgi:hypothetical protein
MPLFIKKIYINKLMKKNEIASIITNAEVNKDKLLNDSELS